MTVIVVDLDGVIYLGDQPIAGAGLALDTCEKAGYDILFATNSSLRTPEAAAGKIHSVTGYKAGPEQVVTSALAAARLARALGVSTALVVGASGVRHALQARGIALTDDPDTADAVVVGLDLDVHYNILRDATLAVRNGATFIATNLDPSYPMPNGQWPGAGAIVELIRVASDVEPVAAGKPDQPMIDLITDLVGGDSCVWMVGDRPSTDLAMAKTAGWACALVLTGVTASIEQVPDQWRPDLVLESIADLPDELERLIGQTVDESLAHE